MRMTTLAGVALATVLLAGCGDDDPSADEAAPTTDPAVAVEADEEEPVDAGDLSGLTSDFPLEVGDCWGLEDEIELDPIPCDGPHIYEVAGIIYDWDYEQYEGGFEEGVAGDEAMADACAAEAAAYFGYDPIDQGIMVDHNEPKFWGHEDKVVCSAHSGPDVEFVEDEVVGSFEDRGWR